MFLSLDLISMKESIKILSNLIERVIQRNDLLKTNNKELKQKLRKLEERVAELENGKNKPEKILITQPELGKKLDHILAEVDKCIDITKNIVEVNK